MRSKRVDNGLTLVEMMAALSIVMIVVVFGIPGLGGFLADQRVKGATHGLMATLKFARSEAVKRNGSVSVVADGSGWASGWSVLDGGGNVLSDKAEGNPRVSILENGGLTTLTFDTTGRLASNAAFTLCNADFGTRVRRRTMSISSSGVPVVAYNGTCGGD